MNQKQWIQIDESVETNSGWVRKVNIGLVSIVAVVCVVLGAVLGYPVPSVIVAIIANVALMRLVASRANSVLVRNLSFTQASEVRHARLFNVVDGLCVVSGDQRPQLRIIDSAYPVAVAVIDNGQPVIAVSETFMSTMDRVEIEGVMAHLLWRLRVGHVALVAGLAAASSLVGAVGLGGLMRKVILKAVSSDELVWADISACQATRFPPALVSALEKCQASQGVVSLGVTDFLCFAHPRDSEHDGTAVSGIPILGVSRSSISERIAILKEM